MSQQTNPSREESLSKHALWLYGVIVGLAIKHALETTLPHLFEPPDDKTWRLVLESTRLFVFLLLIIRFYLGGVVYFEKVYSGAASRLKYPIRTFSLDFMFGTVHYLFFFALAASTDAYHVRLRVFPLLMSVILGYDMVWLLSSWKKSTRKSIKLWAVINAATLCVAAVFYLAASTTYDYAVSQQIAFIPVVFASFIDLAEVLKGKKIFATWFRKLADESETPDKPPNVQA